MKQDNEFEFMFVSDMMQKIVMNTAFQILKHLDESQREIDIMKQRISQAESALQECRDRYELGQR